MKTDTFFHTIFRQDPALLLELVDVRVDDDYTFESLEVKHAAKRIDGVLQPRHGDGPNIFVEFQGYKDAAIYWRLYREVSTWYEQNPGNTRPPILIVLFLDRSLDPGPPVALRPENLIRAYLPECLSRLRARARGATSSPLVVLEPLVLPKEEALAEHTGRWRKALDDLNLSEKDRTFWMEQLEYAVVQRFPFLTLEEVRAMLQLTPLEETVAGKQLIAIGENKGLHIGEKRGLQKGLKQGLQQGELIGQIMAYQRLLHLPVTPREDLVEMPVTKLRALLSDLEARR